MPRRLWPLLAVSAVAALAALAPAVAGADCPDFGAFLRQHDGLERPVGVGYLPDGTLAVLERDRPRVTLLGPDGEVRTRLGEGLLRDPTALLVLADGRMAIADAGLDAVFLLDPDGGSDILLDAGSASDPQALAPDPAGRGVWVIDRDPGSARPRLGLARAGEAFAPRTIEGVRDPAGLAIVDEAFAIVADADLHGLFAVPLDGGPATRILGERGAFPGLFNRPRALALRDGCLYVAEEFNHRICSFSLRRGAGGAPPTLKFHRLWGMHAVIPREGEGKFHYPTAFAFAPGGDELALAEPFERRVQRFGPTPPDAPRVELPPREGVESHFGPSVAADGDLLVLHEPESASAFVFDLRFDAPLHVATFGSADGRGPDSFGRIAALGVDAERQEIAVFDATRDRLSLFRLARDRDAEILLDPFMARLVLSWDLAATAPGSWRARLDALAPGERPAGVSIAAFARRDGTPFALDGRSGEIVALDDRLAPTAVVATGRVGATGLAALPGGGFALALPAEGEVALVDAEGRPTRRIAGDAADPLRRPAGVAAWEGGLAVADAATDRIRFFGLDGAERGSVGERGSSDGRFWAPAALVPLVLDAEGSLAVVDVGNHRVQLVRPDGSWRMSFGLGRAYTRPRDRDAN